MKAFLAKNKRLVYILIPLILYIVCTSLISRSITPDSREYLLGIDTKIPFLPTFSYGYAMWAVISVGCFIYLYFSAGNVYTAYVIASSLTFILLYPLQLYFSIANSYPAYESNGLILFIYQKLSFSGFPSFPAAFLVLTIFFTVFQRRRHHHDRCYIIFSIAVIIFVLWCVFALHSKQAYMADILAGAITALLASIITVVSSYKYLY